MKTFKQIFEASHAKLRELLGKDIKETE